MKTYRITWEKDGGQSVYTYAENLTLKEAQAALLKMFNYDAKKTFPNWGLAVFWAKKSENMQAGSHTDGTRLYWWNNNKYEIVEE